MNESTMFVGLDVHKDSIEVALAAAGREEVRSYGKVGGGLEAVDKLFRRLKSEHPRLAVVYEAGPCGYGLYRHLRKKGIECSVVAPSMIPRRPGDRIKTDRRDAINLARGHRSGDFRAVYVPGPEDEAVRDLTRSREDAVLASKRARQQLGAMLLRQGFVYPGQKAWTGSHKSWISRIAMAHPVQQIVFQEYMNAVDEAHQRVERLTEQLRQAATTWRMAPVVEALQALRGVSLVAGASILAELGDLTRFDDPRQLMAFVGLVPSQYSSGPHQRMGGITKTGNSHARRMLVEAAWAYRFPARVARGLCERQEGLPQKAIDIAWKAQLRLCKKYRRLVLKGKIKQVITTAIARELLGFIWAIAKEVPPTKV
ncbi:MAG: IS110 family transposase [Chloroflexota bacterium]